MKKSVLLFLLFFSVLASKAQQQIPVTFSTDFTDTDIHLFVEDNTVASLLDLLENRGLFLVYEPSATFNAGIKVPLTRQGESLIFSTEPILLDRNTLYEYYFQIGTDGYASEVLGDDIAVLAPGYYRFLYTNTTAESLTMDAVTFNGTAPAGKKALRVKVDMTGVEVDAGGVFAVAGETVVPLVNAALALNQNNRHVYEGLFYADANADVTYTFYNGAVPADRLIDDNTYTATLAEDTNKEAVAFSTSALYEAAGYDLYDPAYIQRIEIKFAESNWDELMAYNKDNNLDIYLQSEWVKINGSILEGAGVKYKGNSSYSSGRAKNPFNISLDEFVSDNKYQNYTSMKLANVFGDPSFVREVLSYEIINNYLESGKANFAQVYVNGDYLGLYTNTESVNKSFCSRHFGSKSNTLVDCSPIASPTTATKSNLRYISDDQADYAASYDLKVGTWESFIALCDTITNNPSALEKVMDVDKFLWYSAFNNVVVNLDSYLGVYSQNYYLYQSSEGRFMTIPWDLNLSFGGFNNLGNDNRLYQINQTQRQQLALDAHSADSYWPMLRNIYNNDSWRKMYLAHCKTIYTDYVQNDQYLQSAERWRTVAARSVAADKNKFYSLNAFNNAMTADHAFNGYYVDGIKTLMDARKNYLSSLPAFTADQPGLSDATAEEGTFSVVADNADRVFLYYRSKGDGHGAFAAAEMTESEGSYSVELPDINSTLEYYFYAENENIGCFLPLRAAYEFYSYEVEADDSADKEKYWIKDDFANHTVEAGYIDSQVLRPTAPNNIQLNTYYTNIEVQGGSCGTGNGLRIRGLADGGYVEFTVPNTGFTSIAVKAKSSSADRVVTIYKNGEPAQTFTGLDQNNCAEYVDTELSSVPVTYKIMGGTAENTNPLVISAIEVEKYVSSTNAEQQLSAINLLVYPNPASDIAVISGYEPNCPIIVYDLNSKIVYSGVATGSQTSISVKNWANSVYIVKCGPNTSKLVVRH